MFACMNSANWTKRIQHKPEFRTLGGLFGYTSVASFSRECHQRVLIKLPRLVVGSFEDCRASHCSLRGCNESEVLACQSKQIFPATSSIEIDWSLEEDTHMVTGLQGGSGRLSLLQAQVVHQSKIDGGTPRDNAALLGSYRKSITREH